MIRISNFGKLEFSEWADRTLLRDCLIFLQEYDHDSHSKQNYDEAASLRRRLRQSLLDSTLDYAMWINMMLCSVRIKTPEEVKAFDEVVYVPFSPKQDLFARNVLRRLDKVCDDCAEKKISTITIKRC